MMRRLTALTVAAALVISLVLCLFFMEIHSEHKCCGEDCAVCTVIRLCRQRVDTAGSAAAGTTVAAALLFGVVTYCFPTREGFGRPTPTELRVVLLN